MSELKRYVNKRKKTDKTFSEGFEEGYEQFKKGSGNVFLDIGHAQSEERLAKAHLAASISEIIKKRGLSPRGAAKLLETGQPRISAIMNGNVASFSLERLIRFLNILRNGGAQAIPSESTGLSGGCF
jgi:predicted XRE-type DNA-binding protein